MGKKESDEHLASVAEGLSEMEVGLKEAYDIFLQAWGKSRKALQVYDVLPKLLEKAINNDFNTGTMHFRGTVYGPYADATTHLEASGITETAPVDSYSRTIAESLHAFEEKIPKLTGGVKELAPQINQLQELLTAAKASCERAWRSNIELLSPEGDGSVFAITSQVLDAQRLQSQLNTPEA